MNKEDRPKPQSKQHLRKSSNKIPWYIQFSVLKKEQGRRLRAHQGGKASNDDVCKVKFKSHVPTHMRGLNTKQQNLKLTSINLLGALNAA